MCLLHKMIIFFAKGNYNSDSFILEGLKRYQIISKSISGELNFENVESAVISRAGKPHFENLDLKFSLSHSKGCYAVAFSQFEVGLDIEKVRNVKNYRLMKKLSAETEEQFFRKWTKLEAYAKYSGEGFAFVKRNIEEGEDILRLEKEGIKSKCLPFYPDYVLTVVSKPQEIMLLEL